MNPNWKEVARTCLEAAESGAMTFPEIVAALMEGGFDGYAVDLRRAVAAYYLPHGEAVELAASPTPEPVAKAFDVAVVREAIREAQTFAPGYSYKGFCAKVAAAGCAGYIVSFPGRRVLYYGRSAETHTEVFPGAD